MFLLILLLAFGGYILYDIYKEKGIALLETEDEIIDIDDLFIYGNHLNLHGNLVDDKNLELVLYNGDFLSFNINATNDGFNLSDNVNEGILLEDIPIGKYFVFLRSINKDEKDNDIYKYYVLNNKTNYKETEYYTFSNIGNKILISSDEEYNTITLDVKKDNLEGVYDVVVDPGHGGMDSGASKNGYKESNFTMKLALDLKEKLESYGVRVKLTREENQLTLNETLPNYGIHGRAVIPYEVKAKYLFSIHLNSNAYSSVGGVEVYTADNINYDFAKKMVKNITEAAGTYYSKNEINKVYDGVYTRTFTENDISDSLNEYKQKKMTPYDITTKSNYYFIIRETGGIVTGAYVDNRNDDVTGNPYYMSNVGCEAYLLELGYLTNKIDLENVNNNLDKYTMAIADTFKTIFVK